MRKLLLAALSLAALAGRAAAQPVPTGWNQFRGAATFASSQTVTGSVVQHPRLKWSVNLPTNNYGSGIGEFAFGADNTSSGENHSRTRSGASIGTNGRLFVPYGQTMVALSAADGSTLWTATAPVTAFPNNGGNGFTQPIVLSTTIAGVPTEIVVTSSYASIVAFRASDGAQLWQVRPAATFSGRAPGSAGPTGIVYYGGNSQGQVYPDASAHVYAYKSIDGVQQWVYNTGAQVAGPVSLSPAGTTAYFVSGGYMHAVDAIAGNLISSVTLGNTFAYGVSVADDGSIYAFNKFDSYSYRVVKFAEGLAGGTTVWASPKIWGTCCISPGPNRNGPSVLGSQIFVNDSGSYQRQITALTSAAGVEDWSSGHSSLIPNTSVLNPTFSNFNPVDAPISLAGGGYAYTADSLGAIISLDPAGGATRWRYQFRNYSSWPGNTISQGPSPQTNQVAISTSGVMYLLHGTDSNGNRGVFAFEESGAATLTISTAVPTVTAGGIWTTTITATVLNGASAPVERAPLEITTVVQPWIGATGAGYGVTPASRAAGQEYFPYNDTNAIGVSTFLVTVDLNYLNHSAWSDFTATATIRALGLPTQDVLLREIRPSSYTVSVTTPSFEYSGTDLIRVTTVTVTVSNNGPVASLPVAVRDLNHSVTQSANCGVPASTGTTANYVLTDGAGQVRIAHRLRMTGTLGEACGPAITASTSIPVGVFVLGASSRTVNLGETRPASFTAVLSTAIVQSDVRSTTMTVTVLNYASQPVPNALIGWTDMFVYFSSGPFRMHHSTSNSAATGVSKDYLYGWTDSLGQAKVVLTLNPGTGALFDTYNDFYSSITVRVPGLAISSVPFLVESNFLSSYSVAVPTTTSVGIPFVTTVTALNQYSHQLPGYNENVNLVPLFDGTAVQGTGTLGTSVANFSGTPGRVVISSQTYNKIETIQLKAVRGNGLVTGLSNTLAMQGPTQFTITIPTGTAAGQVFTGTITAVDAGGNPVVGYGATLSLTSVLAASTGTAASGVLSPATVNLPANGKVVVNNLTYSKGEGIRIRAFDSSLNIEGYSSSITVTAPPLTISHYSITAPTQVTVGLPFSFQVNALDASSSPVTYSLSRAITVQAFLNGTAIAGSGSLGAAAMTLQAGSTYTYTASQTYNKIETIQIKVTDEDGRNVTSGPILFSGPTQFDVTMPTAALAGTPFQIVVVARDAGNNQVLGYSGTVNIAAVQASNTALSGAGTLGVTSLNIASGLGSSSFQTYTKAEGVRLRVTDSAIGVTSYSSSATVRAGTPSSITLLANPQSTIAGVPSVLTATVYDAYTNPVTNSTATFSVAVGSGVVSLSLSNGSVVSAVTSTQAVTDSFGQATAFFSSTNSLSAQGNLLRASLGALARDTTVYSTVLVTSAGGAVVNFSNPLLRADIPANTYGFSVRLGIQGKDELAAADLALTTAAFAATANTFVSTTVLKLSAVRDSSPTTAAGAGSKLVTVSMPYTVTSGSISVGAYGAQSILVPLSVMRIFKLNQTSSVFEQVIDGVTAVNSVTGVVTAEVSNPDGIYALGAPAFTNLTTGSSATVTTALAGGTTAEVVVPNGGFSAPATISVTVPGASAVPALPVRPGLTALGVTISVTAGGLQPAAPVTIKIGYTPAQVAGVNPDHLRLARYDATTGWVVLDSSADGETRQVVGTTDHFSLFQIVAQTPGASVSEGFVFPNPFRPGLGHTRIKLSNLPAGASIKIFTATGRLLKELNADAAGQVLTWDGADRDGRALASGVYLAVIEGTGGRRTIKFAVQR